MSMKTTLIMLLIIILVATGLYFLWNQNQAAPEAQLLSVRYVCDNGKTIDAVYHQEISTAKSQPAPDAMPVPTGSVDLSINGAATTTIHQTISGSGVRYANQDESFVFWNKGNEAIILRNNVMDMQYKNCKSEGLEGGPLY